MSRCVDGLPVLCRLKQLCRLSFSRHEDAALTAQQLTALQAALPNTKINATARGSAAAAAVTTEDDNAAELNAETPGDAPDPATESPALHES